MLVLDTDHLVEYQKGTSAESQRLKERLTQQSQPFGTTIIRKGNWGQVLTYNLSSLCALRSPRAACLAVWGRIEETAPVDEVAASNDAVRRDERPPLNRFRDRGLADASVPFTQLPGRETGQFADEVDGGDWRLVVLEPLDKQLRRLRAELLGYRRLDLLRRWSPGRMLQVKARPYGSSSTRMALNRPWNKEPARRSRRWNHVA